MSDLLAVVGDEITDEELLTEIARRRPDRVTVLAEEERDEDRVASLVDAIEERTGQTSWAWPTAAASCADGGLTGLSATTLPPGSRCS